MKPSEQLAKIERQEATCRQVIAAATFSAAELAELQSERMQLIGKAAADEVEPDCKALDEEIARAAAAANNLKTESEKANATLAALGEKREILAPALKAEQQQEREDKIKAMLDLRDADMAEVREHLNGLVRPLARLIGIHRALEKFDARPGWDHASDLYKTLWLKLEGPYKIEWPLDKKSGELLNAIEVYHELSGVPRPAPKVAKPKLLPPPIEAKGFYLPEGLEDPKPELGWPDSGAALTEWAFAFARRGWPVTSGIKNKYGDVVPDANIAGEVFGTTDSKRISNWLAASRAVAVIFSVGVRRWIFHNGRIAKFVPVIRPNG